MSSTGDNVDSGLGMSSQTSSTEGGDASEPSTSKMISNDDEDLYVSNLNYSGSDS
jgi:hypothetical protein